MSNLIIYISIIIVLLLIGLGGYYLYSTGKIPLNKTNQLQASTTNLPPAYKVNLPLASEVTNGFLTQSIVIDAKYIGITDSFLNVEGVDGKVHQLPLDSQARYFKRSLNSQSPAESELKSQDLETLSKGAPIQVFMSIGLEQSLKVRTITIVN